MVYFEWTQEKEDAVKDLINKFIEKHEVTSGESVMQRDAPNIESVELVGDIVDVLDVEYMEDDEI